MNAILPEDRKRITVYLAIAFGLSWITGLVIFLRGGLVDSPMLIPAAGITEAFVLLATTYLFAPAVAHVLTRLITREGWRNTWLNFEFRNGWPYWAVTWIGTPILIALGSLVYFAVFPGHFDPSLQTVREILAEYEATVGDVPFGPGPFVAIQIFQAVLLSPILNLLPIFGEEFGWRGYLQPKLLPLGERKTFLIMGLVWGLWYAPIVAQGYNYGPEYPGSPWAGVLMFIWVAFVLGTFFGWAALRANSVWPAVIGHAVVNGTGAAVTLFTTGETNPLVGPFISGFLGSIGFTLMTVWIFIRGADRGNLKEKVETP